MTHYGNGYYSIVGRSGQEYLVSLAQRYLNSSVFPPSSWSKPYRSIGMSYVAGGGVSLGGGSARWVDYKVRRVIARWERSKRRAARHARVDARFVANRVEKDNRRKL